MGIWQYIIRLIKPLLVQTVIVISKSNLQRERIIAGIGFIEHGKSVTDMLIAEDKPMEWILNFQ